MSKGRIIILILLMVSMLAVAIKTWGSAGSIILVFGLILMGMALLRLWAQERQENHNDYDLDQ